MKHFLQSILIGFVMMGSFSEMFAQFSISAQMKPRLEFRDGFRLPKNTTSDAAFFVSQRTRLILSYKNEKVKLFISPQDIRVWGSEKQIGKDPSFGLHEAWGQLILSDKLSIKTGRQELVYDGHRLLGNLDWVQQGRSHDALLFKYMDNGMKVDLGGAFNQSAENVFSTDYRPDNYKILTFLHAEKKSDKFSWSGVIINDAYEKNDTIHDLAWRYTFGTLLGYKTGDLSLEGSAYWQGGKTKTDNDIAAYLFNVKASYKFSKGSVAAGLDFVSGDDPNDADFQAFNTLYATNHKFYGFIDYFLNIPTDTDGGGLQDYYLNLNLKAGSKSTFKFFYHQFLLANDVPDMSKPGEMLSSNLGGEIDAVFVHKIASYAKLNVGLSFYFPNATTQQIKGGDMNETNTWGWMMLVLTPELFNSKNKK